MKIIAFSLNSFSQTYIGKNFDLKGTHTGNNKTYIARDYIKFTSTFKYTAQTGKKFIGKIDPSLILDTDYDIPQTEWTNDLPVGSLPGNVNVSPTGAATYSIPIALPPGTAGIMPNLSINYNSQSGSGFLGKGWTIGGFSAITRIPATKYHDNIVDGVNFDENDRFAIDGQRLIAEPGDIYGANGTVYHTEIESFSKITSYGTSGSGPLKFKVETKNGMTLEYAYTEDSRIQRPETYKYDVVYWLLNKVTDVNGNSYYIKYKEFNGEFCPIEINYTGNSSLSPYNKVKFFYTKKTDKSYAYLADSKLQSTVLLSDIKIYNESTLIRKYSFKYRSDLNFF